VLTTNVTLASDITGCPGDGLVVGASNIVINLNGHTLSGSGSSGSGSGVNASGGFENVTVTNGVVKGFNKGVWLNSPKGSVVTSLTISSSAFGVVMNANATKVADNILIGTDAPGGMGILVSGRENTIGGNTSRGFKFAAIFLTDSSASTTVEGNGMSGAGWGIYVQGLGQKVTNNLTHHNSNAGIVFDRQHCTDFNGCFPGATGTVSKNRADSNGLDGIQLLNSGVSVGSNTASYNAGHGIGAVPGVTDLSNNHAASNETNPQCVNVSCS
jgi:parallel beta-helix repeat protein